MQKNIHPKIKFQRDIVYIRQMLRDAEIAIQMHDWSETKTILQEVGATAVGLEMLAYENKLNIKDAQFMESWEIDDIVAAREEVAS